MTDTYPPIGDPDRTCTCGDERRSDPHSSSTKRPAEEKLLTIREVADALGLHYWQVQRAVRRGDIPCYRPFNSRPLLRLSEVLAFVEASRQGGVA